jgi:hypothetical protein
LTVTPDFRARNTWFGLSSGEPFGCKTTAEHVKLILGELRDRRHISFRFYLRKTLERLSSQAASHR